MSVPFIALRCSTTMNGLVTCFERVSPDLFHAVSPSLFSYVPLFLKFRNSVISMSMNVQVSKCPFNCYWMSVFLLIAESIWWEIALKRRLKILGNKNWNSTAHFNTHCVYWATLFAFRRPHSQVMRIRMKVENKLWLKLSGLFWLIIWSIGKNVGVITSNIGFCNQ
jgi:hypothetical protein